MITSQKGDKVYNLGFLHSNTEDSQAVTQRDFSTFVRDVELEEETRLAQKVEVQELRIPEDNQGVKLGDLDFHSSTLQGLLAKGRINESVTAVTKKDPNLVQDRSINSEPHIFHNDDSEQGHYLYREEYYVEVFELGENVSLSSFTGEGDTTFSEWLVRFQDLADVQTVPWSGVQKVNKLKFMLEGVAREKFDQLTVAEKSDYDSAIRKLTSLFENTMSRNIARQGLRNCRQIKGESVRAFMTRLKRLVTACTVGLGDQMFQQVLLDEFMDRLEPILRFHVKTSQPSSVEEALNKALHLEHLIEAQRVAKQEEIEEIAGIVRATIQDSQLNLWDDTGITQNYGDQQESGNSLDFVQGSSSNTSIVSNYPTRSVHTFEQDLHPGISGQIDPVEQVIKDMAEKLAFEAQANTTLRHIYDDFFPDLQKNGH
ncbi:retrotransposon gag protein [Ditylenchus destructor]|nr:retrotransposon gag protein [Ditylenchus destructor]